MMIYFDTNVLVYAVADQGVGKYKLSKQLIEEAFRNKQFFISELVLLEYIFGLSKLKIIDKKPDTIDIV